MRPEPRWWPFQAEDVWVFALPAAQQGDFTSLTVEFATEGGPVTENITTAPAGDRAIVGSRAWIRTPAGLSSTGELVNPFALINATAVITGTDGTFDLAQTCPASGATASPSLPVTGAAFSGPTLGKSLPWAAVSSWSASCCFARNGVVASSPDPSRFLRTRGSAPAGRVSRRP